MPHLAFYAAPSDIGAIARFVLEQAGCVVYESHSVPDAALRTFADPAGVVAAMGDGSRGMQWMLHAPSMKGAPVIERIELKPGSIPGKSWRESVSGWGLVTLQFGGIRNGRLAPSDTNHNTEKRALAWEATYPGLGPASAWDFREVARISRSINRHISARLACRKEGTRFVLPGAQALIEQGQATLGEA